MKMKLGEDTQKDPSINLCVGDKLKGIFAVDIYLCFCRQRQKGQKERRDVSNPNPKAHPLGAQLALCYEH